ncbi:MAG: THUMP domain-containing protein [Candidatus Thermoplasmatota archaeon]|jgi:thiamine biosynthesis protein ThiI|nr:THUMP domain-containing protein [Candidatus Thermoplasmatota archaeon]MCL5963805.1 THUMP domain-containing protein [Candidatus Thermoplasmatota archaeon]
MHQYLLRLSGEIFMKSSPVRKGMFRTLSDNIYAIFINKKIEMKMNTDNAHFYIETYSDNEQVKGILSKIFGISSYSQVYDTDNKLDNIKNTIIKIADELITDNTAFGLSVKKSNKGSIQYSSQEIAKEIGKEILERFENKKIRVDLDNPDIRIYAEIRDNHTYIYSDKIRAAGGLPAGSEGSGISIINGKESLISAWLMMRRGVKTTAITCQEWTDYAEILRQWDYKMDVIYEEPDKLIEKSLQIAKEMNVDSISAHIDLDTLKKYPELFQKFGYISPTLGLTDDLMDRYYTMIIS